MSEVNPAGRRRHVLDGAYTVALLAMAILHGVIVLGPDSLRATPLLTDPEPARVSSATDTADDPERAPALLPRRAARPAPESEADVSPRSASLAPLPSWEPTVSRQSPDLGEALAAIPEAPPPTIQGAWPAVVSVRVLDPEGRPVVGASVVAGGREHRTNFEGTISVTGVPADTPILIKMPGYRKAVLAPGPEESRRAVLEPHVVKAAYLTYYGIAHDRIRGRVFDLLAQTELNAVVIDVKGDRGWIPYRTEVAAARAAGAQGPVILRDFETLLARLKARGIYTIARIVVFKDNVLAASRPELAVINATTGQAWIDNERLAWVDPFREEVWDYNIAIAREAAEKGFDEIQFDYVRFPTDGRLGVARFARPSTTRSRLEAIAGFLARARRELGATGAFVAADVFGYTAFNENDTDIGQRIEELAPHLDYLCPMVYPSGYHVGIPGFRNPVAHPYEVVHESVKLIRRRAAGHRVRVRPWLQDFRDYAFDRRYFGVSEIRAQIRGADEAGGTGWMLWNPRNRYTGEALRPESPVAAR